MSLSNRISLFLWMIILFINLNSFVGGLKITDIYPRVIQKDAYQPTTTLSLFFNEDIINREETEITLSRNGEKKKIRALDEQDRNNNQKVYFEINQKEFEQGKYELSFKSDNDNVLYEDTILIYENEIILKNPLDRYFLSNATNQGNTRLTYFTFKESIIKEEIYKITYYRQTNKDVIKELTTYELSNDGLKLDIKLDNESFDFINNNSYIFNIYPEYDREKSTNAMKFKIHFFCYLLLTDAIYVNEKSSSTNLNISLITKTSYTKDNYPFSISETTYGTYPCNVFECGNKSSDNTFRCNCEINIPQKSQWSLFSVLLSTAPEQNRTIYLIPYTTNIEKCYIYGHKQTLYFTPNWDKEMKYNHFVYFNDPKNRLFTKSYLSGTSSNYSITIATLNAGKFGLYSIISDLGDNRNDIDKANLHLSIFPGDFSFDQGNTNIFFDDDESEKKFIISSTEGINSLDKIKLKKDNIEFTVSKTDRECENIDNFTLSCDLKDQIKEQFGNIGKEIVGTYNIYYINDCGVDTLIHNRTVTIKQGYNLINILPSRINKKKINETDLILVYDTKLEQYVNSNKLIINLYKKGKTTKSYTYESGSGKLFLGSSPKEIILKLDVNTDEDIYFVETIIVDYKDDKNTELFFKVFTPLEFTFDHHYFVLGDNERNYLQITVQGSLEKFNCKIIEHDNQTDELIHVKEGENCRKFKYKIKKTGIIYFDYYDDDNFKVAIDDSITVVDIYEPGHDYCYYYEFEIPVSIFNFYQNIKVYPYLETEDKKLKISLIEENSKYKANFTKLGKEYYDADYYLYVTEGFEDTKGSYLYKSKRKIRITEVLTPEYVINPYTNIIFTNVKCDLSSSSFTTQKANLMSKTIFQLTSFAYIHGDNLLNCSLPSYFYQRNLYQNFNFFIEGKQLKPFGKNENCTTFISNKLSDSLFTISHDIDTEGSINVSI